ncbi:MAG: DUF4097 domain-containing protein [Ruminococcaceae bacterium]|nr:DUF4097 domain-containing protein [Oscillospiraceae bacterium]
MKKIFMTSGAVMLMGCILFLVALTMSGCSFVNIFSDKLDTNSYDITESFSDISVNADTADITFLPSEDGICRVVCRESKRLTHTPSVEDGRLTITCSRKTKWYDHIMAFDNSSVTVYLPSEKYGRLAVSASTSDVKIPKDFSFDSIEISLSTGDVTSHASADEAIKITVSTGKILLGDISASSLEVGTSTGDITLSKITLSGDLITSVSTGDIKISDLTCQNLSSDGTTGDIDFNNVTAFGDLTVNRSTGKTNMTSTYAAKFSIEADTGKVMISRCDADEVMIKTSTGDVTCTFMSEKIVYTDTSTGDIDIERSATGGICDITTSTGDITVRFAGNSADGGEDQ